MPTNVQTPAQVAGIADTTAASPADRPQEAADTAPVPAPAAEAEAASGGVSEVEELDLAQASTFHHASAGLPAVTAIAPGTFGHPPPRYRGQAPPATA